METSLPYYYQHYQQPYSGCDFFYQQTTAYDTRPLQYARPRVDWQARVYHSVPGSHADLSPRLRCHLPAYRCSLERGRRHADMSPPAVTRCVSTLSSPFIADRHVASSAQRPPRAADPAATTVNAHPFVKWLDCGVLERADHDVLLCSDRVCRSLVDTSQRPSALNDAICMYIDYLTRDNERVIGELSVADDERPLVHPALTNVIDDELYRDMFCQPSCFPTSRFRDWLQVYSIDLEITDPNGRRLTEATFPGCACAPRWASDRLTEDWTQRAGVYRSQSEPTSPTDTKTRLPAIYNTGAHEMCASRVGHGRGRGRGRPGRRGCAKRKSYSEYVAVSYRGSAERPQQRSGRAPRESSSTVDVDCSDDSAVVEFLASLQSDAEKRRCRLQQQMTSHVKPRDVQSQTSDRVIEEVVDDEFQINESGGLSCLDRRQQQLAPAASPLRAAPQCSIDSDVTHRHGAVFPVSRGAVGEEGDVVPVKVVRVNDVVGN